MLSTTSATVGFATSFTQVIVVLEIVTDALSGTVTTKPSTTVPIVSASYIDPGIVITPAIGQVTISGQYKTIIKTTWTYLDKNGTSVSIPSVPDLGTFKMITKVASPANLKETCVYTIGSEAFTHTVDLGSYSGIGDKLKSLLATVSA